MLKLPEEDLHSIVARVSQWQQLDGGHLLITGGTGFVGKWLLASVLYARQALGFQAKVTVLSRNPQTFLVSHPELADQPGLNWLAGELETIALPDGEQFTHVIHAAANVSSTAQPSETWNSIVQATVSLTEQLRNRVYPEQYSKASSAHLPRFLNLSSGAVYGAGDGSGQPLCESVQTAPSSTVASSVYGLGKRAAELQCTLLGQEAGWCVTHARLFSTIGPHLPLQGNFAAGNFLLDASQGEPIVIQGDGQARRSYLYAAETAAWLWTILFEGRAGQAYNVGSAHAVSMAELASLIALKANAPSVQILNRGTPSLAGQVYLPDTQLAQSELGLSEQVDLSEAISKTLKWIQLNNKPNCSESVHGI